MYTFLDPFDNEYGAVATISLTNAVNGEKSIKGEIYSNDAVLHNLDKGWRLRFKDEYFVITYAKPKDTGSKIQLSFDAVHQFFWDFSKKSANKQLPDGSHTFQVYLEFIFGDTDYTYNLEQTVKAFEKQSFGYKSKLALFNDIISTAGLEFQVNGKVVRILEKTGTDLSTVVRKKLNMNELTIEKNIGSFITCQKGFGAWIDKDNHNLGRLEAYYESPLAREYGRLEGEPVVDERYTSRTSLIAVLQSNVENSYTVSVQLDMEDLTQAGYRYDQPVAGDYIMAINETLGFKEKIRIVSFTSQYDVKGKLISHKVTCNDIGSVKKQSATYNKIAQRVSESDKMIREAISTANSALVTADGKNTAYFGTEFPRDVPKGTLTRGDIFYRTVGDRTLMYFWNGSDWEDNPVLNDVEEFKRDINQQFNDFNESYETEQERQDKAVKEVLDKASAAEDLARQAKLISDQSKLDAANALTSAQTAKNEAIEEAQRLDTIERKATETKLSTAKSQAITEASRLIDGAKDELAQRLLSAETEITKTSDEIKTLAKKSELDTVNNRLSSTESSVTQMSNKIETEISRIEGKIPENVGAVNLLKNGTFENEGRHWESVGLDDKVFADFAASAKRYAGRVGLLIKNDPYRTITEGTRGFKQTIIGPFNPSEKLTFSADLAYTGGDFGGMTLKVIYKSATDAVIGEFSHTFRRADMSTGYRRFTKTIDLPKSYIPKIDVIIAAEDGKVADIYITRAQLERGTIATDYSKSIDELDFDIETVKTTITQTAEGVKQISTKVTENDSKISNAETKINQLVGEVSSKVSQTDFNKLNSTVSSQATTLSQQANQISLKADKSYVDNVNKLVSQNSASLSMFSDAIEARVLKSDFDTVTGRMTSAETTIKTIAGQIETKLSRTDADKIVTNAITQSEKGTIQRISEVEGKIPTEVGGVNLLLNSDFSKSTKGNSFTVNGQVYDTTAENWATYNGGMANATTSYHAYVANLNGRKNVIIYNETNGERNWKGISQILDDRMPQTTNDFVLSLDVLVSSAGTKLFGGFYYYDISGNRNFNAGQFQFDTKNFEISKWQRVSIAVPFNKEKADFSREVRFYIYAYNFSTNAILAIDDVKLETGKIATAHSLALEEIATTAAVHEIRQTVDGYSRTISEQGKSISQVLQTAQGLVSRVENLSIGSRNLLKGTKDLSTTDRQQYVTTDKYLDFAIARTNTVAGSTHDTYRATTTTSLTATEYVATFYARASRDGAVVINHFFSPNTTLTGISSTNPMRTATDGAVYLTLTTEWQRYWIKWTQTPTDSPKTIIIGRNQSSTNATVEVAGVALYEGNTPQDWSPAPEDSEVPLNAVRTEMSQLAGSWAVKNLTSAGTVLNQINLMANGTNRIDGRLTHITGSTLIDNAVIKDANIASLSASKMTTGTLDAGKVNVINLNANNITSGSLTADRISGGILRSLNGDTTFNLQTGALTVDNRSMINLKGAASAIFRETKYNNSYLMFHDFESSSSGYNTVVLGANTDKNFNSDSSGYTGLYISPRSRRFVITANSFYFQTNHNSSAGLVIDTDVSGGTNIRGITYNPITIGASDKPIKQIFVDKLNNLEMRRGGIYGSTGGLDLGNETHLYSNNGNVELSGNDINFVYKVNGTRYQLTLKDILRQIGYKV
ncbi:hypothetical protein GRB29_01880 [Streptococcus pneumoniae]|nr:hypothetical protein [Streptococcus pneumoniae]